MKISKDLKRLHVNKNVKPLRYIQLYLTVESQYCMIIIVLFVSFSSFWIAPAHTSKQHPVE